MKFGLENKSAFYIKIQNVNLKPGSCFEIVVRVFAFLFMDCMSIIGIILVKELPQALFQVPDPTIHKKTNKKTTPCYFRCGFSLRSR